jgi:hypothetical protein
MHKASTTEIKSWMLYPDSKFKILWDNLLTMYALLTENHPLLLPVRAVPYLILGRPASVLGGRSGL